MRSKTFKHQLLAQDPFVYPYGTVHIVDFSNFPISTTTAAALVEVKPDGMREMHWHLTPCERRKWRSSRYYTEPPVIC